MAFDGYEKTSGGISWLVFGLLGFWSWKLTTRPGCALQIVVLLADERILNWCRQARIEAERNNGVARRLRFLDLWAKGREFEREFSREGKRKDHLFGLKTSQGEIVPFM